MLVKWYELKTILQNKNLLIKQFFCEKKLIIDLDFLWVWLS